jgi:pimeloyl-ACP methyl ester carboxylesterase
MKLKSLLGGSFLLEKVMTYAIEGFKDSIITVPSADGPIEIACQTAGSGPALLLLHGFPQTKAIWRHIAPELAKRFSVVLTDLRGYGASSKPAGALDHSTYSKRSMAADQHAVMQSLGHQTFSLLGHDRGGRVSHRLAIDFPESVERLMVLDISPTLTMYENTSMEFAKGYWHWFFLIQSSQSRKHSLAPIQNFGSEIIWADMLVPRFSIHHHGRSILRAQVILPLCMQCARTIELRPLLI